MAKNQDWEPVIQAALSDVRRLDDVTRYSSIPVVHHELVSTHSYWVALYSAMIHTHINPKCKGILGPLLLQALTHDMGEALSGDIVRTFKYSSKPLKKEIDKAEKNLAEHLPREVRQFSELPKNFDPCAIKYIKAIVKAADFLSLFQYMRREAMRKNLEIIPFYERMISDLGNATIDNHGVKLYPATSSEMMHDTPFLPGEFYTELSCAATEIAETCFPKDYQDKERLRSGGMRIV